MKAWNTPTVRSFPWLPGLLLLPEFFEAGEKGFPLYGSLFPGGGDIRAHLPALHRLVI